MATRPADYETLTGAIWKRRLRVARAEVNIVSQQIKMKLNPQNPTPEKGPNPMVTYTKNEPHGKPAYYTCLIENGGFIGVIDQEADGFYRFHPVYTGSGWDGAILKDLAKKLEALNEAWNLKLNGTIRELEDSHKSPCTSWTPKNPPKK
jgi:hypothetical protein